MVSSAVKSADASAAHAMQRHNGSRAGAQPGAQGLPLHYSPFFRKFTGKDAPDINNMATALRFTTELDNFPSHKELVWRLVDPNTCPDGMRALTSVLRRGVSEANGISQLVLPLLRALFRQGDSAAHYGDMAFGTIAWLVRTHYADVCSSVSDHECNAEA